MLPVGNLRNSLSWFSRPSPPRRYTLHGQIALHVLRRGRAVLWNRDRFASCMPCSEVEDLPVTSYESDTQLADRSLQQDCMFAQQK